MSNKGIQREICPVETIRFNWDGYSPSSALFSHSTNFFICSRKKPFPLARWASVYHFRMASSLTTFTAGESEVQERSNKALQEHSSQHQSATFIEQQNNLLEGVHEVDVVVAVLLNPQQKRELRQALSGEGLQERAVLLRGKARGCSILTGSLVLTQHRESCNKSVLK